MSVNVALGWAAIVGSTQANMGTYLAYNDATTNLTITTANGSNPRIDLICMTVSDSFYSGSLNQVAFQVIAGTPAGTPTAPTLPADSISLATILVGTGVTSILTANITDTRTQASAPLATLSGVETLSNKTLTRSILVAPEERATVSATAATGTINYDALTQGVLYYTTNATGNTTINLRGNATTTLNSILAVGDAITLTFLQTNGVTAYYPTVYQVDGSAVTPKWQGGTAPTSGNASSTDAYVLTVIKTAATPTYTVFASQTKFS
jgi:hypothetical protein